MEYNSSEKLFRITHWVYEIVSSFHVVDNDVIIIRKIATHLIETIYTHECQIKRERVIERERAREHHELYEWLERYSTKINPKFSSENQFDKLSTILCTHIAPTSICEKILSNFFFSRRLHIQAITITRWKTVQHENLFIFIGKNTKRIIIT